MAILKFYKNPGLKDSQLKKKFTTLKEVSKFVSDLEAELCYYVESKNPLDSASVEKLKWVLRSPFLPQSLINSSFLEDSGKENLLVEIGPRLNFSTAFSSNAVSICKSMQLEGITRIEVSTRYLIKVTQTLDVKTENKVKIIFFLQQ